jgi:3-oxoacyl-[acyl-carrier protein] reductase
VDYQLKGKVAVVTGASAGIGLAITKLLCSEGVTVVGVARREPPLLEAIEEVRSGGAGELVPFIGDITQKDTPKQLHDFVKDRFGTVHILVNNAGDSRPVQLYAPDEIWHESMFLNFDAARRVTEGLLPLMIAQQWGRVLNVTATSEPPNALNAGTPPKAAMHIWAKALSRVVGPDGITVNSIPPGKILSEQITTRLYPTEEARTEYARQHIPLGKFGEAEDLAHLVVFLASPIAHYITGQVIHVDGGASHFAF